MTSSAIVVVNSDSIIAHERHGNPYIVSHTVIKTGGGLTSSLAPLIRSEADMGIHQARRRVLDRRDDPAVSVASADVSGQGLPDLGLVRARVDVEEGLGAHQKPGRAEPALAAVVVQESTLHGVKLSAGRETLDGEHLTRSNLQGEHLAGVDRDPVEKHRAGATLAAVASSLRAGQVQNFA